VSSQHPYALKMSMRLPARSAVVFILVLLTLAMAITLVSASEPGPAQVEKRQTSSAPSFRFTVHSHAESAIHYAVSPGYVSLLIGGASVLIASMMT